VSPADALGLRAGKETCARWHVENVPDPLYCVTHLDLRATDWALTFDRRIGSYSVDGRNPAGRDLPGPSDGPSEAVGTVSCGIVGVAGVVPGVLCSLATSESSRRHAEAWESQLQTILNHRTGNAGTTTMCASFGTIMGNFGFLHSEVRGSTTGPVAPVPDPGRIPSKNVAADHLLGHNPFCTGSSLHWENQAGTTSQGALTNWIQRTVCPVHPSFRGVLAAATPTTREFVYSCQI